MKHKTSHMSANNQIELQLISFTVYTRPIYIRPACVNAAIYLLKSAIPPSSIALTHTLACRFNLIRFFCS